MSLDLDDPRVIKIAELNGATWIGDTLSYNYHNSNKIRSWRLRDERELAWDITNVVGDLNAIQKVVSKKQGHFPKIFATVLSFIAAEKKLLVHQLSAADWCDAYILAVEGRDRIKNVAKGIKF